jgi:hypothetical protein
MTPFEEIMNLTLHFVCWYSGKEESSKKLSMDSAGATSVGNPAKKNHPRNSAWIQHGFSMGSARARIKIQENHLWCHDDHGYCT